MIDRQGNRIFIECDSCEEVLAGEEHQQFKDLWSAAKRDGWKTRQIAGEWLHSCPNCPVPT